MKRADMHVYLAGGDRRSIGRSNQLVELLRKQPDLLPDVIREMWNPDPVVAMRTADVVEKLTRTGPESLQPFGKELLGLAEETTQQELRWHLAAMIPRLKLSAAEQRKAVALFTRYLDDKSSIVKTFALQGLFELAVHNPVLRPEVEERLRIAMRSGTPAMRARSRMLLSRIAKGWVITATSIKKKAGQRNRPA